VARRPVSSVLQCENLAAVCPHCEFLIEINIDEPLPSYAGGMNTTPQIIHSNRLTAQVPRYTSYPTAPHFHAGVTADTYRQWLTALPDGSGISLYLHIPYCDRLCWFCACNTRQTRQ